MRTKISKGNRWSIGLSFIICSLFSVMLASCASDEDPYFTADENDAPRILNTDIPEGEAGNPGVIATIDRSQNFEFELIVTPVHHTNVVWFIDDEQVAEGLKIDVPVIAGDHTLKIVATTTKGLSTSRTCQLVVRSVEGDPALANDAKSRWLTIGTTKTVGCENVTGVSKVFIGKQAATNVSFADGKLTFDVPTMAEGEYPVIIQDAAGKNWGCGLFVVSSETYTEPGITETLIWEGATDINWGDSNVFLSTEAMANVPVGSTIRLVYEIIDAEYHALRVTNQDWSSDIVSQIDGFDTYTSPYEFTYTADHKAIADSKGMLITGFGYKLTQVFVVEGTAPVETTIWEGATDINWGDSNVFVSAEEMAGVPVGATVSLVYEIIDAEYHSLRVTNQDWSSDIVPQIDGFDTYTSPYEFTYTADHKAVADAKGMLVTGFGYKLTKVIFK